MRRIALAVLSIVLLSGPSTNAQEPATLGRPIPAAELRKPITRGVAGDTPTLTVPDPVQWQASQPNTPTYPPPGYTYYPPPPPQAYLYYSPPPTGYAPAPAYAPQPTAYAPAPVLYAPTPSGFAPAPVGYAPPPVAYAPGSPYVAQNYGTDSYWQPVGNSSGNVTSTSLKGDPVRRTSFSSRSRSVSRSGEDFTSGVNSCCDWLKGCLTADNRTLFESDHCFDKLATPVTNPFLFEDPRSLTEVRPIFLWQTIPNSAPITQGGNAYFYGLQARVALTDWLSFTLNKLGGVSINADNPALNDPSGLAEIWLGPKFTFVRLPESCTVAAFGLQFQIPAGPSKVFQDTGSLSVVPYLSFATAFGRSSYGGFQIFDTFGIALDAGSDRSDYFFNSFSLGYDIVNVHKYYLMLDLNWFHYTSSGDFRPVNAEGRDFANLGATDISGNDYLTIAPAFRWKINECVQFGIATEFAITNPKDYQEFRLILDMIFRY